MDISKEIAQKAYQQIVIYFFSGTGNARKVASWIAQVAAINNIETKIIDIARMDSPAVEPPPPGTLIIFISPVHGFNYPPIMLHFLNRFPRGKNNVVLMNTRAGMLIGKFITPGMTGIAFYLAAFILWRKGFSIKAFFPVDMPSNWISLHPGLNQRTVQFLHEKNKERVEKFAQKILRGKSHFKALLEVYDIFLAPVALAYYLAGRFFLAKTFYASRDCDNCDLCIKACPVKAIIKVDNRPFWTFNCESCMKCMSRCPKKAIETGHGYIFLYVFVFQIIVQGLFFKYIHTRFFHFENVFVDIVLESALLIACLALWYRLVHWLLRFRIPERMTVYTSLTKYKCWGRRYNALKAGK